MALGDAYILITLITGFICPFNTSFPGAFWWVLFSFLFLVFSFLLFVICIFHVWVLGFCFCWFFVAGVRCFIFSPPGVHGRLLGLGCWCAVLLLCCCCVGIWVLVDGWSGGFYNPVKIGIISPNCSFLLSSIESSVVHQSLCPGKHIYITGYGSYFRAKCLQVNKIVV